MARRSWRRNRKKNGGERRQNEKRGNERETRGREVERQTARKGERSNDKNRNKWRWRV